MREKIDEGIIPSDFSLVHCVVNFTDKWCYRELKPRLGRLENDDLILLYRSGVPDPEIEETILARLFQDALKDEPYLYSPMQNLLKAVREHGTLGALPGLERIERELTGLTGVDYKAALSIGNGDDYETPDGDTLVNSSALYVDLVRAIRSIKKRRHKKKRFLMQVRDDEYQFPDNITPITVPDAIKSYLEQAESQAREEPEIAANSLRKFLEGIARFMHELVDPEASNPNYNQTMQMLENGAEVDLGNSKIKIPRVIGTHLRSAKPIANHGSHWSDEELSATDLLPALDTGSLILNSIERWIGEHL